MTQRTFRMLDLFAGAGGTSEGFRRACEVRGVKLHLTAINHWPVAIETHSRNHPDAEHFCASVHDVDPCKAVPGGYLDCLCASPECIYHSSAKGGGPCNEQSRSGARDILRWLASIETRTVLIENVKEFRKWGPLYKRGPHKNEPIKKQAGTFFRQFLRDLRGLGYQIDHAILNAADYGAATSRRRFFLLAHKGRDCPDWPAISHVADNPNLFQQSWRSARDVIDWDLQGQSIFARQAGLIPKKKPLCEKTIRRICHGLEKFSGLHLDPYIVMLYGQSRVGSVDLPLPTVTTSGGHLALCEPYLVQLRGTGRARNIDRPTPSITTSGNHLGLCRPYLVPANYAASGVTRVRDIGDPMPTLTTKSSWYVAEPFVLPQQRGRPDELRTKSVDDPLPTIASKGADAVVESFLVKYYSKGAGAVGVDAPMPTVTTHDRCALVEGDVIGHQLDIRYRMLEPHELSKAMGFDASYTFAGNKTEIKKQIGNAVEVHQSTALAHTIITDALRVV